MRAGEGERLPVGDELSLLRLEDGVLQAVRDQLAKLGELMGESKELSYCVLLSARLSQLFLPKINKG